MLGDEEGDASLAKTPGILFYHVVTHNLNVAAVGLQQIVAHDVRLRCHGDAVVGVGMLGEVFLQHLDKLVSGAVERQVERMDLHLREMVVHVVAESHLAVVLLLTHHLSVLGLAHQHHFFLAAGNHAEHLGCKVARAEGILSEEGKRTQVGHVGVKQDERNAEMMQLLGEFACHGKRCRHHDHSLGSGFQNLVGNLAERGFVRTLVELDLQVDMEITALVFTFSRTFLNLFPVSLRLVLREEEIEGVLLVVSQSTSIHVWLVIHFLEGSLHLLSCGFRHVRAVV